MTILERVLYAAKVGALASVVFVLVCLGIASLRVTSDVGKITTSTQQTLTSVQQSLAGIQKDVDNISTMANAAIYQAEEVLHHTDVLVATENQAQQKQIAKINEVLGQLQLTVQNLDKSQQLVAGDLDTTLHQTTLTVKSLQPLTEQLTTTVKSLQDTVQLTQPILKNTNEILSHVNNISADAQKEVHDIVYPTPKPWYAKMWGVTKLASRMLTIPLK